MLAATASGGSSFLPLLMIVVLFAVMYFLMIRPQQKRRREATQMQTQLGPGDRIQTIGGLHATVIEIDEANFNSLILESVGEQVPCSPIKVRRAHNVVAGTRQILYRKCRCGLA